MLFSFWAPQLALEVIRAIGSSPASPGTTPGPAPMDGPGG